MDDDDDDDLVSPKERCNCGPKASVVVVAVKKDRTTDAYTTTTKVDAASWCRYSILGNTS
jgi:hypothetical protein